MPADLDLPAADFVPQTGTMCLLDRIIAADAESLVATTVLKPTACSAATDASAPG